MADDCFSYCADSESYAGRLSITCGESFAPIDRHSGEKAFTCNEANTCDEDIAEGDNVADVASAIQLACNIWGVPRRPSIFNCANLSLDCPQLLE